MSKVVAATLSLVIIISLFLSVYFYLPCNYGSTDFAQYWGAAKLVLMQQNPYDASNLLELQRPVFCEKSAELPILMWNPPNVFFLIWPLAFLEFKFAVTSWLLLNLMVIVFSLKILQDIFNPAGSSKFQKLSLLCCLTAPSVFLIVYYGQISPWLLLGVVLFLKYASGSVSGYENSFRSGLALSLTLIKPHLLFIFYFWLLLQSCMQKKLKTLLGLTSGLLVFLLPALLWYPNVFVDYYEALKQAPPLYWKTPSLGSYFQAAWPDYSAWLVRFAPTSFFLIFAILLRRNFEKYFSRHEAYILFLLLSVFSSPYGWGFDQVILFPVIFLLLKEASTQYFIFRLILFLNLVGAASLASFSMEFFLYYSAALLILFYYVTRAQSYSVAQR